LAGGHPNKSFQPTKPFVTALACARPAPNAFVAEADVRHTTNGSILLGGSAMRIFLTIFLAYAASKAVFALFDFQYSPIGDPFSASKLAIDFGVYVVFFVGFNWLLGHLGPFRSKDDA
jgi:hypothetical protein